MNRSISFRETVRAEARGFYKLKKQTGGPGQFAIVELRIRPLPRDSGIVFVDAVVEGRIPPAFVPSVEKGVREVKGVLANQPIVDVEVTVTDGAFHKKDSHARDFQFAGAMAFRDALRLARPALLEPFARLEVRCPAPAVGAVLSALSGRRGRIRGTDYGENGYVVLADVPALELGGFETQLASITSGLGRWREEPGGYDVMPEAVQSRRVNPR